MTERQTHFSTTGSGRTLCGRTGVELVVFNTDAPDRCDWVTCWTCARRMERLGVSHPHVTANQQRDVLQWSNRFARRTKKVVATLS